MRADLRRKLAWMLRIRRDAASGTIVTKAEAQALAAAFPGALRELDDTPLSTLEQRFAELEDGVPLPPWAPASWLYHATMRELLEATRLGDRPRGALVDVALARVAEVLGVTVDEATSSAIPHARRRRKADVTSR